ncbi:MAG: type VI secretion system tube protein TssD [Oceanihabitans sp.]
MSFLAKLTIEDQEFNVLDFSFEVTQQTDSRGLASGYPNLGALNILIESSNDLDFYAWSINSNAAKDGKIIFYKRDAMAKHKTIEFNGAVCVGYKESFNSNDSSPMKTRIIIRANAIIVENTGYVNNWAREY